MTKTTNCVVCRTTRTVYVDGVCRDCRPGSQRTSAGLVPMFGDAPPPMPSTKMPEAPRPTPTAQQPSAPDREPRKIPAFGTLHNGIVVAISGYEVVDGEQGWWCRDKGSSSTSKPFFRSRRDFQPGKYRK